VRARRKSLPAVSRVAWPTVMAWIVVISAFSIGKASFRALAAGARQLGGLFEWERIAEETLALYQTLVNRR
jgi:hypothetical protein